MLRLAEQRLLLDPPCSVASFEINSEPHTGARPLGPHVCGANNEHMSALRNISRFGFAGVPNELNF